MTTRLAPGRTYHFSFPRLDTLLQLEETDGAVVIRASRDTFSETRRQRFVRELAAEGFIPDQYRWSCSTTSGLSAGIRWIVDPEAFQPEAALAARPGRFMLRLLGAAAFSWLVAMTLLFLSARR